jgi:hypothetical protein
MKHLFTIALLSFSTFLGAQGSIATFDELPLSANSFWNGSDLSANSIVQGELIFPTNWDTSFGGYLASGFAYSNMTDSVTSSFANIYSAKPASGFNNSANYAITYGDWFFETSTPLVLNSARITNSTFAFNSMRDGDNFAKKFGGPTGNDPDFFSVTFTGYLNGQLAPNSTPVTFYLADFRFEDNNLDYIVRDWRLVDLSPLGTSVDSITYNFASSDVGTFGINTPTYFCIDQVIYNDFTGIENAESVGAEIFPNPASSFVQFNTKETIKQVEIFTLDGKSIQTSMNTLNSTDVSAVENGFYLIQLTFADGQTATRKLIVKH